MIEVEGFILAGGASSRMGADKSRLCLGGRTFVGRVADALSLITQNVTVVTSRHAGDDFGLPVVPDIREGVGALGGLHAALAKARAPWVAVVSCDLPFVTGQLLERLSSFAGGEWEAVAPVQSDGRPQPLCALYARGPCLAVAEELLREGELRPRRLLARVRTFWVTPDLFSELPGGRLFFTNVNTPSDYERALQEIDSQTHVQVDGCGSEMI